MDFCFPRFHLLFSQWTGNENPGRIKNWVNCSHDTLVLRLKRDRKEIMIDINIYRDVDGERERERLGLYSKKNSLFLTPFHN